jgi:diguanylate cyclase (GGDEF)-like protein/PAS domain S-box-containing protein
LNTLDASTDRQLWRRFALCWADPQAAPALAARYRHRQFLAVARLLPMASLATYLIVAWALLATWQLVDHWMLLGWSSLLLFIGGLNIVLWWRHVWRPSGQLVSRQVALVLALDLGLGALLYGGLVVNLFGQYDDHGRVVLASVAAAFIATGAWMFAALPLAGALWLVGLCGTIAAGLLAAHRDTYAILALLVSLYGLFLLGTVLITSRKFIAGLRAETEIEHQRELVGLLLRDFEERATDWLWETDEHGRLRHVSVRLTEATGRSDAELKGRSLAAIIESLLDVGPDVHSGSRRDLARGLSGRAAFSDAVVPVRVDGARRWWSFAAKPLWGDEQAFTGWRGVCSDITEAHEKQRAMARLANVDTLTGLASRHQFGTRLAASFPASQPVLPCTLLMLDLDNFKAVNDSLGHAAGDELLRELASRLSQVVPSGGLAARLGGDEFALLLSGCLAPDEVAALGHQVRAGLARPWVFEEHQFEMRASVGVSFAPQHADRADQLMKAADMALYAAKAAGRDTLCLFTPEMAAQVHRKQSMLSDMRKSLEDGDFVLHYQPQIDARSGDISGFEALVRWRHPVLGMVAPLEFISIAEDSGLILPLGEWVLRQSCLEAARWPVPLRVAVNVSALQIERSDLGRTVHDALAQSGLAPERLELELTESTLMRDGAAGQAVLRALRASGVRIALDDFGTGFSSLSYLRTLPLDKLKVDRSFVRLLDAPGSDNKPRAIVQAIVQLARTLGLDTTAEGVETLAQSSAVQEMGCTFGQGYLHARPMPAAEVQPFIAAWRRQATRPVPTQAD